MLAGYWLIKRELLTDRLGLTYKGMVPAKFGISKPIAFGFQALPVITQQDALKQRILESLNLEDTSACAFAIERSRGVSR